MEQTKVAPVSPVAPKWALPPMGVDAVGLVIVGAAGACVSTVKSRLALAPPPVEVTRKV